MTRCAEANPHGAETVQKNCEVSAVAIQHGSAAVLGQGCLHARCVQTVLGSRRAENCGVPQLQFSDKVDMPVVATTGALGAAGAVPAVVDVPVIMQ